MKSVPKFAFEQNIGSFQTAFLERFPYKFFILVYSIINKACKTTGDDPAHDIHTAAQSM